MGRRSAERDILPGMTRAILLLHGYKCRYCGRPATDADHIDPTKFAEGGRNLTAACRSCNSRKGRRRLPPAVEQELLKEAWINAPLVEELTHRYWRAQLEGKRRARARDGEIDLAEFVALQLR